MGSSRAVFRQFKNKISVLTWMSWLMKNSFDWSVIKGDYTVINHFIHHQTYCAHTEKSLRRKCVGHFREVVVKVATCFMLWR